MVGMSSIPRWLQILLEEKFFSPCMVHESAKKNEKNTFCLDCCISICLHCLHTHRPHRLLQIRRYVYHDVIRLGDAKKLMNCSLVQPYTTNSAKVVFLHKRPIRRPLKSNGNLCMKCDRSLQNSYLFCSISCKIHHLVASKRGIGKTLVSFDNKTRCLLEDADHQSTPDDDSLLDSPVSLRTWSRSGSEATSGGSVVSCRNLACTVTMNNLSVKKKKRSVVLVRQVSSRRKSVPHRAPLN